MYSIHGALFVWIKVGTEACSLAILRVMALPVHANLVCAVVSPKDVVVSLALSDTQLCGASGWTRMRDDSYFVHNHPSRNTSALPVRVSGA